MCCVVLCGVVLCGGGGVCECVCVCVCFKSPHTEHRSAFLFVTQVSLDMMDTCVVWCGVVWCVWCGVWCVVWCVCVCEVTFNNISVI